MRTISLQMRADAEEGRMDLVKSYIEKITNEDPFVLTVLDYNEGMCSAAKGGFKNIVQFFIDKGANDFNEGMAWAALGGHRDLVEFFIQLGADDLNDGMLSAIIGGHNDLVEFFIEKGADPSYAETKNDSLLKIVLFN